MKTVYVFMLLLAVLAVGTSRADTVKHTVRIACVPEAGLLHLESGYLHDSVAYGPASMTERDAVLARAGFHDPHHLAVSCALGGVTYSMTATQDETSGRMCGGDPEVYVTVTRDGQPFLTDVVFGNSCHALPSVESMTVGDGPRSWRGRETRMCYLSGKDGGPAFCDWTFGAPAQFTQRFPIDQARLAKIGLHEERR